MSVEREIALEKFVSGEALRSALRISGLVSTFLSLSAFLFL